MGAQILAVKVTR